MADDRVGGLRANARATARPARSGAAGTERRGRTVMPSAVPPTSGVGLRVRGFAAAWETFRNAGALVDHWAGREAWTEESVRLAFVVPLGHHCGLVRAIRAVQERLGGEPVDPVPGRWLHASVLDAGFRRDLTVAQRRMLVEAAGPVLASSEPFDLAVGNVNSFPRTVVLEVHDGGAILALRGRLRAALPWLADRFVVDGVDTFLPHVSIGFYRAAVPNSGVVRALAPLRRHHLATVAVQRVDLTSALKPRRFYRWSVEASFVPGSVSVEARRRHGGGHAC